MTTSWARKMRLPILFSWSLLSINLLESNANSRKMINRTAMNTMDMTAKNTDFLLRKFMPLNIKIPQRNHCGKVQINVRN